MEPGLIIAHVALATVAFLTVLNGYLEGTAKRKIDAVLSLLLIGLLVLVLAVFGLVDALVAGVLSLVYGALARPLAHRLGQRLVGQRLASNYSDEGPIDFSLDAVDQRKSRRDRKLSALARRRDIRHFLSERGMSEDEFREQHDFLMRCGLGELAFDIMGDPQQIGELVTLRQREADWLEIVGHFTQLR